MLKVQGLGSNGGKMEPVGIEGGRPWCMMIDGGGIVGGLVSASTVFGEG